MIYIKKSKSGHRYQIRSSAYNERTDETIDIPLSGWIADHGKANIRAIDLGGVPCDNCKNVLADYKLNAAGDTIKLNIIKYNGDKCLCRKCFLEYMENRRK